MFLNYYLFDQIVCQRFKRYYLSRHRYHRMCNLLEAIRYCHLFTVGTKLPWSVIWALHLFIVIHRYTLSCFVNQTTWSRVYHSQVLVYLVWNIGFISIFEAATRIINAMSWVSCILVANRATVVAEVIIFHFTSKCGKGVLLERKREWSTW